MNRDEIFDRIRTYLVAELQVDPESIQDGTSFKEDLRADSLHLMELVVELEDTYGVRMPEEEAAKIQTVGEAADFVAAHLPSTTP